MQNEAMNYDLDELKRLEKAATPGPWNYSEFGISTPEVTEDNDPMLNGVFLVAARNALPDIIRDLQEQTELIKELATALARCNAETAKLDKECQDIAVKWGYTGKERNKLRKELHEARKILREVEWAAFDPAWQAHQCPHCYGYKPDEDSDWVRVGRSTGHYTGCRLKAWLERVSETSTQEG